MRHYVVGEWTDFVRNLVSEKERLEMELHRASCAECQATLEFLQKVAAAAEAERTYESGAQELTASAREVFVQRQIVERELDSVIDRLPTLAANLTYHSFADPGKCEISKIAGR
jgi:hypothetical protein